MSDKCLIDSPIQGEDTDVVDPLEPVEKVSYACSVCGVLKMESSDARQCASDDTRKLLVERVEKTDTKGYPVLFQGVFRTEVRKLFAEVLECGLCEGTGEVTRAQTLSDSIYPCDNCKGLGYFIKRNSQ